MNFKFEEVPAMQPAARTDGRVLIVDDDENTVDLIKRALERRQITQVLAISDPRRVIDAYDEFKPDLVILDLVMPGMSGFEVLGELREKVPEDEMLPIVVLTADCSREARRQALDAGATDFISKPFDNVELVLRIRNLLRIRLLYAYSQDENAVLEDRVRQRTREVVRAQMEIIDRLSTAAELRDDDTGRHTARVGMMSAAIAEVLGLSQPQRSLIRRAAPLHDVGKIGIPDHILLKQGPLTPEEFDIMKTHTTIGAQILAGGRFPILKVAERIAMTHHENWNGTGYPNRITGEAIPIEGRIVAIADVYDALTHDRPYKRAWPKEHSVSEIISLSGRKFDPAVVEAFVQVIEKNSHENPALATWATESDSVPEEMAEGG